MYFWSLDVGQGAANVLMLGDGRAAVFDCGPASRFSPLRPLLSRYVREIDLLAVSHNDADHRGAAAGVLTDYAERVHRLLYAADRAAKENKLYLLLRDLRARGRFDGLLSRLEVEEDGPPRLLLPEPGRPLPRGREDVRLKLFAPTAFEADAASAGGDPNAASGILALSSGPHRIVISGDAPVSQFRSVAARRGGGPMAAEVLLVPHHGGRVWRPGDDAAGELKWLFSEGVRPRFALVSVGTSNTHKHPRPEVIDALLDAGVTVLCTQITKRCCRAPDLEQFRLTNPPPGDFCQSLRAPKWTDAGNSRDVPCAGTVRMALRPDGVTVERVGEHQRAVDRLAATTYGAPLCRRADCGERDG
ncbi:ComEC/Rec2 family competence protein [Alienimonas sp. DA493]|uniref:ComEC/Rec2 family competence protein n=1 Tax=Alienimonas sp. DA493 TaxID=3373605 RepID=UPI003754B392